MPRIRVLVDTNILISGIVFRGNEAELLHQALEGRFTLVLPDIALAEARRVIDEKFSGSADVLQAFMEAAGHENVQCICADTRAIAEAVLRDRNDTDILAAVLISKPNFAITGDKDLLTSDVRRVAPFVKCKEFLSGTDRCR